MGKTCTVCCFSWFGRSKLYQYNRLKHADLYFADMDCTHPCQGMYHEQLEHRAFPVREEYIAQKALQLLHIDDAHEMIQASITTNRNSAKQTIQAHNQKWSTVNTHLPSSTSKLSKWVPFMFFNRFRWRTAPGWLSSWIGSRVALSSAQQLTSEMRAARCTRRHRQR